MNQNSIPRSGLDSGGGFLQHDLHAYTSETVHDGQRVAFKLGVDALHSGQRAVKRISSLPGVRPGVEGSSRGGQRG